MNHCRSPLKSPLSCQISWLQTYGVRTFAPGAAASSGEHLRKWSRKQGIRLRVFLWGETKGIRFVICYIVSKIWLYCSRCFCTFWMNWGSFNLVAKRGVIHLKSRRKVRSISGSGYRRCHSQNYALLLRRDSQRSVRKANSKVSA